MPAVKLTDAVQKLIPAAGYIRMSTDKQEDSPERQRRIIQEYAARHGYELVAWYSDEGKSGLETSKRTSYQQLIADLKVGTFAAVLFSEQSRMSRQDLFDVFPFWKQFRDSGVQMVSCTRGPVDFDSLGGMLTAIIDQHISNSEPKLIRERVVSGYRRKLDDHERPFGGSLFGYDRVYEDANGTKLHHVNHREKFRKPSGWKRILVPTTEPGTVEAIRDAFELIARGGTLVQAVRHFYTRGVMRKNGTPFNVTSMKKLLRCSSYAGHTLVGSFPSKAKIAPMFNSPELITDTHAAIVSPELFEAVQQRLNDRKKWRPRVPGAFLLSGQMVCGVCGSKIYGRKLSRNLASGVLRHYRFYCCPNHACQKIGIHADVLEAAILAAVRSHVFHDQGRAAIARIISQMTEQQEPSQVPSQIAGLKGKIDLAERNLAMLVNPANVSAVDRQLTEWRRELQELEAVQRRNSQITAAIPDALQMIAESLDSGFDSEDGAMLVIALRQIVETIRIATRTVVRGNLATNYKSAVVTFREGVCEPREYEIPESELHRPMWRIIAEQVQSAKRPLTFEEIQRMSGQQSENSCRYHLNRAIKAGLVLREGINRYLPGQST